MPTAKRDQFTHQFAFASAPQIMRSLTYDTLDRVILKDIYSAQPQSQTYSYDLGNQIANLSTDIVNYGAMYNRAYTYDNVGNRLDRQLSFNGSPFWTENYTYNNIYELTQVSGSQTHSFAYDKVNNRTTVDGITYNHNNLNQYTTIGPATLTHDGNGNTTFDGTNTFTYDDENRMIAATNAAYNSTYTFDALNRRVNKTVTATGIGTFNENYIYSDEQIIEQVDPSGNLLAVYIYGNDIDEPLNMFNGQLYVYHRDGLGSIDAILDWDGNPAEFHLYDVYGLPSSNSAIGNLLMFTGRQWDYETETYQYRARQYSPTLGRFLQRDPIGYGDGMNIYAYTKNNPVNFVDPMGLLNNSETEVINLSDSYLQFQYQKIYRTLQEKPKNLKNIPQDEANFDTDFWTGYNTVLIWDYHGKKYFGNEINYIGIGMYEAWKGSTLESAINKTKSWKFFMYAETPSAGTLEWLERGYNKYQELERESCYEN